MPNRLIKDTICTSADVDQLTPSEEVFFYRLIVNCDDYGRMDARIPILKSRLYPLKENMISDDINGYLVKLSEIKPEPLIILYSNKGVPYLQMTKWEKHQQIRAKRSKFPAITDKDSFLQASDIRCNQLISFAPVIQSNPIQSESESSRSRIPLNSDDEDFKKCIKCYENNIGLSKGMIAESISKYLEEGFQADLIIKAIEKAVSHNARSWAYADTILRDWGNKNILTVADYEASSVEKVGKETGSKEGGEVYCGEYVDFNNIPRNRK